MKRGFSCVLGLLCLFVLPVGAYGNAPPADAPVSGGLYISCNSRELGETTIYLPVSWQNKCLTFDSSGNLFNLTSSTISGFAYSGSTKYQVRWSSFSAPQYRVWDSGYQYSDLTVLSVYDTNADIVDSFDEVPVVGFDSIYSYAVLGLLGVMILCLFRMRFRS